MRLSRPCRLAPLLLVSAFPVTAQQPPDTARTERDTVFPLPPVVVTASHLQTPADRLGFAMTSVRATAERTPWAAELLERGPGSFLDEAAGPGGPTIVRLRGGEEVFTQVLIDGVRVNQNGGFFDFQGLSLSNLAGVDIARGPQSAVYGSSAVSGVVSFTTPRGRPGEPRVALRAQGGSASDHGGSWQGAGAVRGGSDRFRYSAGLGSAYARGIYEVPHDTRTHDGSVRLDWAPGDGWETTFQARRIEMASMLPVRDAGATRVPLDPNARNDRDRTVASLTLRRAPSAARQGWVRVSTYRESFAYEDRFDGVSAPEGESFFVFDANLLFLSDLERTTAEAGGSARAGAVEIAYGGLFEREGLEERISGDFGGDPLVLDRHSVAGYGEFSWRPTEALVVGAGVRVEKFEALETEATPRASVRWAPGDGRVALRAAAGRAYKAPNLQQQYVDNPFIVANPDLRAERSVSVEAGLDLSGDTDRWRASATLFRQRFDDLIRTVALEGDSRQINRNLGASRATGVEWDADVALGRGWRLDTRGAWLRTTVLDNVGLSPDEYPEGEGLPFRPDIVASLALAYEAGAFGARLEARRVGEQLVLSERFSGRRVPLDAYTLVGATGHWQARQGLRLFVRAENLLGTEYATAFDRPGIPATGSAGFEVVF